VAASQLQIYNQALRICGELRLASLTEDREPRHLLDQVWAEGGVDDCLEQGQWNFAMRAVQVDDDPAVSPAFGLTYGFTKPTDWIRTAGVCSDERFQVPYLGYKEEAGYWYADITPLYIRYVSNDSGFGGDLSLWPGTFQQFVAAHFADEIILKLTSDKERVALVKRELRERKLDALNKDAMNDPTAFPAKGSWVNARGRQGWRRDGGNRGSLIG
jgi:hypothetical protein